MRESGIKTVTLPDKRGAIVYFIDESGLAVVLTVAKGGA